MSGPCCLIWLQLAEITGIEATTCFHCRTQWQTERLKKRYEIRPEKELIKGFDNEVEEQSETSLVEFDWYVLRQGKDRGGLMEPVHVSDYVLMSSTVPEEKTPEKKRRKRT